MAIDQREALIAAVKAQVEKEKAVKAAKLKKEQDAMRLSGEDYSSSTESDGNKPKYKTLSAEDLAKIAEKKRRKQAAEQGIDLDLLDNKEPVSENAAESVKEEKTSEGLGMSVGIQTDKSGKTLSKPAGSAGLNSTGGLSGHGSSDKLGGLGGSKKEKSSGLGLDIDVGAKADAEKKTTTKASENVTGVSENKPDRKLQSKLADKKALYEEKAKLQPTKLVGGSESVKVIGDDEDDEDTVSFSKSGDTTIISEGVDWQASVDTSKKADDSDDIISIVPNRMTPTNDVKSMYDIDDDDDDILGAELSKLANFDDGTGKAEANAKKKAEEEAKKKTVEEAKRKAELESEKKKAAEEAKRKAELEANKKKVAEEAKRKAELEAEKKKAIEEEARKKKEAQRKRFEEAERRAQDQARRIAEAESKRRAEEAARKRAEEAEERRIAEETKRKALEEKRIKAAEEARKKAEEEARKKAKDQALKIAEEARKKAEEAAKILEEAKKAEEEAAKRAEEDRKRAEEEAKRKAEEEAKRKAEEEAKKKAEEEAKKKAEQEAKRKAEEEAKRKAEEEAKRKAEEEARKKAQEDAKKAAEEARKRAEEAMRFLEEAKKAEEEALRRAEETQKSIEEEAKKAAAEEELKKAEEAARKKAEEEAAKKAQEEADKKAKEEAAKKAQMEADKKAQEEARRQATELVKKAEEEAKRKAEEARKILEEAKLAEKEALKAADDAESITLDLTKPTEEGKLPLAAYYLEKYTKVEKISTNIIESFNSVANSPKESRNIVILGEHGFGLTSVGEDFARSFYDMGICKNKTIAKIKAVALNKVKLVDAMVKLTGGCLVVENVGLIATDRFKELVTLSAVNNKDVVIILTGEKESVNRLFSNVSSVANRFKHRIEINGLSNSDMLNIARGYIVQRGFKADDSVDGAIRNLLMAMESGNIDRMLKTIDDAMIKCEDREKVKNIIGKKYLLSTDFK